MVKREEIDHTFYFRTPEVYAKIGEPSFFRTFCDIFAGRETVVEAPSVGFDASIKEEYKKKAAIIKLKLTDKLINFAAKYMHLHQHFKTLSF